MQNDPFKPKPRQPGLPGIEPSPLWYVRPNLSREAIDKKFEERFGGQCAGCGFLGVRSLASGRALQSADLKSRAMGELWKDSAGNEAEPWCAKGMTNLLRETISNVVAPDPMAEVTKAEFAEEARQILRKVLREDRRCVEWRPFTDGFSPAEHLEFERQERINSGNTRVQLASIIVAGVLGALGILSTVVGIWWQSSHVQDVRILVTPTPSGTTAQSADASPTN